MNVTLLKSLFYQNLLQQVELQNSGTIVIFCLSHCLALFANIEGPTMSC